ncbi:exopolysaccharide biosynthesis protein [Kaistia defluvii]|uniref:Exopolysaccharide biosynthesis protein n=1 Tax=Kaistia defluvii TaxID=410841 RepID=A0ABV2R5Y2_9HYPH
MPSDQNPEDPTAAFFRTRSASAILADLGSVLKKDRVSLGDMVDALGEAGLGLTILMLALPSFIPIPGLPTGFVFGTALAILSLQIMVGADRLLLPQWLRRRSLPRGPVVSGGAWIAPWFKRVEWMLRPRYSFLAGKLAYFILAVPIFVHAVMILLPIPLGNQLPSLAVIVFAFGLIERDGLAVIVGWVLTVIAIAWNSAIVFFGAELSLFLYRWTADLWASL